MPSSERPALGPDRSPGRVTQAWPPPPSLTSCFFHCPVSRISAPKQRGEEAPLPSFRWRTASMAGTQLLTFAECQRWDVGMLGCWNGAGRGIPGHLCHPLCMSPSSLLPSTRLSPSADASSSSGGPEHSQGCGERGSWSASGLFSRTQVHTVGGAAPCSAAAQAGRLHLRLGRQVHQGHVPKCWHIVSATRRALGLVGGGSHLQGWKVLYGQCVRVRDSGRRS